MNKKYPHRVVPDRIVLSIKSRLMPSIPGGRRIRIGNVYSLLLWVATMRQTVVNSFVLTDSHVQKQRVTRAPLWFERVSVISRLFAVTRDQLVTPIWPCHSPCQDHATSMPQPFDLKDGR